MEYVSPLARCIFSHTGNRLSFCIKHKNGTQRYKKCMHLNFNLISVVLSRLVGTSCVTSVVLCEKKPTQSCTEKTQSVTEYLYQ